MKIRPRSFFRAPGDTRVEGLGLYLVTWPADRYCKVVVSEGKSKRSEDQNALWWAWNHELSRAHDEGEGKDYYHAYNKLYVLLPLMCHEWERWREEGEFIRSMIVTQPSMKAKLRIAYDCIESSDLDTSEGSDYTEALQRHWHDFGIDLVVQVKPERYNHPEAQRA